MYNFFNAETEEELEMYDFFNAETEDE
jgi:hypothetical protein